MTGCSRSGLSILRFFLGIGSGSTCLDFLSSCELFASSCLACATAFLNRIIVPTVSFGSIFCRSCSNKQLKSSTDSKSCPSTIARNPSSPKCCSTDATECSSARAGSKYPCEQATNGSSSSSSSSGGSFLTVTANITPNRRSDSKHCSRSLSAASTRAKQFEQHDLGKLSPV
uniref:(northern house mosquito) hypothetical protein n=1 Tax=Culex pipiens TaxID=7175 RepID=A0A8D8N181_CULPI